MKRDSTSKEKSFFASCPKGLEDLLAEEVSRYGQITKKSTGGVNFKSSSIEAIELLFRTRFASRVFMQIEAYYIESEKELYRKAKEKWWHRVFDLNQTFKIAAHIDAKSRHVFTNDLHMARVLKDAVADSFRDNCDGKRPFVDTRAPDILISLRIEKNLKRSGFNAIVSLDLSGGPLSDRGHRQPGHRAPLRENLAAGMVALTKWPGQNIPLYDPMCGSGTILIEAAMMGRDIAPSYLKIKRGLAEKRSPFSFLHQAWFKDEKLSGDVFNLMQNICDQAKNKLEDHNAPVIYGSDRDSQALEMARASFNLLGLPETMFKLEQKEFQQLQSLSDKGVIITNPPYGKRLEEKELLKQTYRELGETLKEGFKGHEAYILTSEPELSREIGLKCSRKHPLYNGNLDCRLLKYDIF